MKNKIAFIIPYFGKLPQYFPLFLNSIKDQPFDVLFFSDIKKPQNLTDNIKWISFSFSELQNMIAKKINIDINLHSPYKLCDYKPSYGLCFEDYLSEYQFWGSLDVDTVVGNFGAFVTTERLQDIDMYSAVKEYVSGALFIMRNNDYCNNLFKKSKDWKIIFQNPLHVGFDECCGSVYVELKAGKSIFELNMPAESFTEVVFKEQAFGLRTLFENTILEPRGRTPVEINNRSVKYDGVEYIMVHFIYFKARYYFYINPSLVKLQSYYLNGLGNFKNKPTSLRMAFSKNLLNAIIKKININIKKLKF
ncbi:DUF6625 family protein [Cytophaga hutchinsonii]|uniref:Uncharacterized protein n=1 Tax=Cytophaga hutchinsonii (strain ATCC 33406 / DSM 1761 / CIP 103989 / NBRC 15051 / NCIMB 9469 / D465) TaxID=269798 RepID=A0A6N4SPC9_CYTH3|nr:DUF6625 family protein [Cytophaga hutchinsonii]ABG58163.1 conserved hypothetical protein [Cytophaga hutchinsonii ATCC 33406]SFY02800.1 hypothetical protein SAMN04487930_12119 [Cytophaga hutchinsonii ATCC 33406]